MADAPANVVYEGSDLEALSTLHRYQKWIVETFQPHLGGRAIEIGAGMGNISTLLRPHVDSLYLVEPSANLGEPLRRRFEGDSGVKVLHDSLETWMPGIAETSYDSIILVNVLEHVKDDAAALEGIWQILKPGGKLMLFVPALKFLFSDLDALHGHYRRYYRDDLNRKVRTAGFKIVESRYFDSIGILPWWLLNTKMGATKFNPFLAKVYDIIFAPLSRGLESIIEPPFGKNILLIAKRPDNSD